MIPFPKMNIAQSVINRISNTLEQDGPLGLSNKKAPVDMAVDSAPEVPNPAPIGQAINMKIAEPMEAVSVAPENKTDANSGMLEASVMGGSPFDGALVGMGS